MPCLAPRGHRAPGAQPPAALSGSVRACLGESSAGISDRSRADPQLAADTSANEQTGRGKGRAGNRLKDLLGASVAGLGSDPSSPTAGGSVPRRPAQLSLTHPSQGFPCWDREVRPQDRQGLCARLSFPFPLLCPRCCCPGKPWLLWASRLQGARNSLAVTVSAVCPDAL